jgi:hypothetical protein
LEEQELKAELEWTVTNPWQCGIKDIFNIVPHTLLPYTLDLYREEMLKQYKQHGFTKVGLRFTNFFTSPVKIFDAEAYQEYMDVFPYISYAFKDNFKLLKNIKRIINKDNSILFLIIDIDSEFAGGNPSGHAAGQNTTGTTSNPPLHSVVNPAAAPVNPKKRPLCMLLKKLEEIYDIHYQSFKDTDPEVEQKMLLKDFYPAYNLPHNACLRNKGLEVMSIRRHKEASSVLYHSILKTYSFFDTSQLRKSKDLKNNKEIFPYDERTNVSSMHGHATLLSSLFSVHFLAGQICGLKVKETPLIPDIPTRSYLTIAGKQYTYSPYNTFSIEGDMVRGLRSMQVLHSKASKERLSIDFFLIEDFPYLLSTAYICYPQLKSPALLEATAPLEIPLFLLEKDERVHIYCIYKNGSHLQFTQAAEPWQKVLLGSLFFVQKEKLDTLERGATASQPGIVFGFPPNKELSVTTCPFMLEKQPATKNFLLKINPFGSWKPDQAKAAVAKEELFSFFLGVADACPTGLPHFPDYVLKEIPVGIMGDRRPDETLVNDSELV